MGKLRKTNKQKASERRRSSNIVNIEAKINKKNEKNSEKKMRHQSKAEKKQRIKVKKQKSKTSNEDRLLSPRSARLLVFGVIFVMLFVVIRVGTNVYSLKKQEQEALAVQQALKLQEAEMQKQVDVMNTPEYLEQQARNILHMIKPGELLYIPDSEDIAPKPEDSTSGEAIEEDLFEAKPGDQDSDDEE